VDKLLLQGDDGVFRVAPDAAGAADAGYGMGVAVGDADNDGDLDLYVANYGPDAFYRNRGDGTFENATADAGIGNEAPRQGHWLAVRAIDPTLRRNAIGARIEVQLDRR
jgi:hypothetical protein